MADTLTKPDLSPNESIKESSALLRGTIVEGLGNGITGSLADDDTQLTKFHGTYQQDDRDLRPERRKKKMEPAYSFMIRVRVPGGVCSPDQWLAMDAIADTYANGTLRLTTRQAFQFHGVIKTNLKTTMKSINDSLLDTLAACGDVNRNVMCNANPARSEAHATALQLARDFSDHMSPRTGAYHEIWLNKEKVVDTKKELEPLYGPTYLPRKFKTVIAVPPENDVDVFAHDLGYIAILNKAGKVTGYTITVGGGMGMTHGEPETFPRTADILGFCTPAQAIDVGEKIITVQRDYGDRSNRKHARLKYTIEDRGIDWFRTEVEKRLGYKLKKAKSFKFTSTGDRFGWVKDHAGKWHYTMFIESGRIKDTPDKQMKTGLAEIARVHRGEFRLSNNQNLVISNIGPRKKAQITKLLEKYGLDNAFSALRLNSMACVSMPTCALGLAESERYLPSLIDALDEAVESAGLRDDEIVIRMTGCPNGCARPYLAEIGLVGRGPGTYNLYLGAAFDGSRLNKLHLRDIKHDAIVSAVSPLIERYAKERDKGERFGDFVIRAGIIAATTAGNNFHHNLAEEFEI